MHLNTGLFLGMPQFLHLEMLYYKKYSSNLQNWGAVFDVELYSNEILIFAFKSFWLLYIWKYRRIVKNMRGRVMIWSKLYSQEVSKP